MVDSNRGKSALTNAPRLPFRWRFALLPLLLVLALPVGATKAIAQQGWDNAPTSDDEEVKPKGPHLNDPFEKALQMIARGNCKGAMPILAYYAKREVGGEIAQLEIGHCMIVKSQIETSQGISQGDIDYGIGFIIKSADAGLRDAQEEMVRMYLDGKYLPYDPPEAGKWYYVWKRNVDPVGDLPFDPALMARLSGALTAANWKEAEDRSREWRKVSHTAKGTIPLP